LILRGAIEASDKEKGRLIENGRDRTWRSASLTLSLASSYQAFSIFYGQNDLLVAAKSVLDIVLWFSSGYLYIFLSYELQGRRFFSLKCEYTAWMMQVVSL
jgi:hypothetical protein